MRQIIEVWSLRATMTLNNEEWVKIRDGLAKKGFSRTAGACQQRLVREIELDREGRSLVSGSELLQKVKKLKCSLIASGSGCALPVNIDGQMSEVKTGPISSLLLDREHRRHLMYLLLVVRRCRPCPVGRIDGSRARCRGVEGQRLLRRRDRSPVPPRFN